ncbi:MAG TPA: outer membrane lipoprotein carrier protein LolA [Sediminispirochaeta sp.]|nr:outer membrane lipoprotein carrier protein LolA [Sediminispirochaeta sp.]
MMEHMKIKSAFLLFVLWTSPIMWLTGQEILTSSEFFRQVSEHYGTVEDYRGRITITHNEEVMEGQIYYKSPNLMRIDFIEPEDQVLVVDGVQMMLFLPQHHVVMRQELSRHSEAALTGMASERGLELFKQNYSIAFLDGPEAVPLDEGSDEMVRQLKLAWRTPGQGFRQIEMSVNENMMIRRLVGITDGYETFQFDFENIEINQDIPDSRFEFDNPPSAYTINNFLFDPEE